MLYTPCKHNHSINKPHYANYIDHPTECVSVVRQYTWQTKDDFTTTPPIQISCVAMQCDTLSPYLFIISLELLLQWLDQDQLGYCFNTSPNTMTTTTYVDDLGILIDNIEHIQPQLNEVRQYPYWAQQIRTTTSQIHYIYESATY